MVPRIQEVINIANVFQEHLEKIDMSDAEIVFSVDPSIMKKLNEDFYYRNGGSEKNVEEADEICVKVSGITFRYVPKK